MKASQLKENATIEERLYDFLGRYTIVLNGTMCEKQANQPIEISSGHQKEVVEFVSKRLRQAFKKELNSELLEACKMMLTKTLLMNPEETKQVRQAIAKATKNT